MMFASSSYASSSHCWNYVNQQQPIYGAAAGFGNNSRYGRNPHEVRKAESRKKVAAIDVTQ